MKINCTFWYKSTRCITITHYLTNTQLRGVNHSIESPKAWRSDHLANIHMITTTINCCLPVIEISSHFIICYWKVHIEFSMICEQNVFLVWYIIVFLYVVVCFWTLMYSVWNSGIQNVWIIVDFALRYEFHQHSLKCILLKLQRTKKHSSNFHQNLKLFVTKTLTLHCSNTHTTWTKQVWLGYIRIADIWCIKSNQCCHLHYDNV